jgi:hypothetical protein
MMGHRQVEQAALFYEFSLEKHVPPETICSDRLIDLSSLKKSGGIWRHSTATSDGPRSILS